MTVLVHPPYPNLSLRDSPNPNMDPNHVPCLRARECTRTVCVWLLCCARGVASAIMFTTG